MLQEIIEKSRRIAITQRATQPVACKMFPRSIRTTVVNK